MVPDLKLMDTTVTAVVVNYDAGACLLDCVESLRSQVPVEQIIIVDNASRDDSIAYLRRHISEEHYRLILNTRNRGFAAACNQGAAEANSGYLLLLNPDCVVLGDAVFRMVSALSERPEAVLAGPWIIGQDGKPQRANRRLLPNLGRAVKEILKHGSSDKGEGVDQSHLPIPRETLAVEAVSGACMLFKRFSYEELEGMDEAYMLHCEDLDIMKRIQIKGWKTLLVPEAQVMHVQGVSSRSRPLWVEWQKHKGMWRYYNKFSDNNFLLNLLVYIGILGYYFVKLPRLLLAKR